MTSKQFIVAGCSPKLEVNVIDLDNSFIITSVTEATVCYIKDINTMFRQIVSTVYCLRLMEKRGCFNHAR